MALEKMKKVGRSHWDVAREDGFLVFEQWFFRNFLFSIFAFLKWHISLAELALVTWLALQSAHSGVCLLKSVVMCES